MKKVKKSMLKACTAAQLGEDVSNEVASDVKSKKKTWKEKKKKQRKNKKTKMEEKPVETVVVAKEEENVKTSEALEINKLGAAYCVEISDNIVLRKLLRGPRYFDPPDSAWRTCYNCGEGGHTTAKCSSVKRKKPCFGCGSLKHHGNQCQKRRDCFICERGGHLAKSCPEKQKWRSQNSKKCLKCGDFRHNMFSCKNDYSPDDLKEIQCYICNSFGHLCCAAFGDIGRREPSCYRCGQLGHTGLECQRSHGEPTCVGPLSSCFKCGEGGHFALECTRSTKVHKRNLHLATPTRKSSEGNRETGGVGSMPSDSGKSQKRKKAQYEGGRATPTQKSSEGNREIGGVGSMPSDSGKSQERKKAQYEGGRATPTWKSSEGNRETGGVESMPSDSGKSQKRKRAQYEGGRFSTPPNLRQRGGLVTDYSRAQYEGGRFSTPPNLRQSGGLITEYSGLQRGYAQLPGWGSPVIPTYNAQVPGWGSPVIPTYNAPVPGWGSPVIPTYNAPVPGWGSPVIPTYNGNLIYAPIADGHPSSSHFLRRAQELQFGHLASNVSPIFYQDIYPRSINGNFSSYGIRSNHRW